MSHEEKEETLDEGSFPRKLETLRHDALCADTDGFSPEAEQYWLLAIGALEQAQRFATLALYAQRRARTT